MPDHITFAAPEDAGPTLPRAGESKGTLGEGLTSVAALGDLRLGRGACSPSRPAVGPEAELLAPLAGRAATAAS